MTLLIVIALVTALIVAVRVHQVKTAEKKLNEIKENGFDSPGLPIQPVEDFHTGATVIETDALAKERMEQQLAKESLAVTSISAATTVTATVEPEVAVEAQPKKVEVKKKAATQKPKTNAPAKKAPVKTEAPKAKKQPKK